MSLDRHSPPRHPGQPAPSRPPVLARQTAGPVQPAGRPGRLAWLGPFLTGRTLAGALVVACLLLTITLLLAWLTRPARSSQAVATAMLQVIPAATQTSTPVPDAANPGSGTAAPTPPAGSIAKGGFVQVTGTGGDGLRLRDAAGLNGKVVLVASEAEVFKVEDGPQELDGYTWWYLVGPFDAQRRGWAVVNYLQAVQGP